MNKLAFLFLIYDEINHETIWNSFFSQIDQSRYNIYIHYKNNKPLKYFQQYKLGNTIPTKYADLSLVKAQNLLLREALKDTDNQFFIFLSNSCIPLKNFNYIYNSLYAKNSCFFNLAKKEHIFENHRGKKLAEFFGKDSVKKSSQWCILTRDIATILAESDDILELSFNYEKYALADEYFYISYLYYLNKQGHIHEFHYEAENCTTFEYWDDKEYVFKSEFTSTHPIKWERRLKTFYNISSDELNYLLQAPCLFGRKFSQDCTVDYQSTLKKELSLVFDR